MAVDFGHILLEHVTNTYNLYRKRANELMFEANALGAAILVPKTTSVTLFLITPIKTTMLIWKSRQTL